MNSMVWRAGHCHLEGNLLPNRILLRRDFGQILHLGPSKEVEQLLWPPEKLLQHVRPQTILLEHWELRALIQVELVQDWRQNRRLSVARCSILLWQAPNHLHLWLQTPRQPTLVLSYLTLAFVSVQPNHTPIYKTLQNQKLPLAFHSKGQQR